MGNMMRRGRINPSCKCCNVSDDPGWRTREKHNWKKELEDEKDAIYKQGLIADIEGNKNYEEWE